jgi:hypothetical protein
MPAALGSTPRTYRKNNVRTHEEVLAKLTGSKGQQPSFEKLDQDAVHADLGGAFGLLGMHVVETTGAKSVVVDPIDYQPNVTQRLEEFTRGVADTRSHCLLKGMVDAFDCATAKKELATAVAEETPPDERHPHALKAAEEVKARYQAHVAEDRLSYLRGDALAVLKSGKLQGTQLFTDCWGPTAYLEPAQKVELLEQVQRNLKPGGEAWLFLNDTGNVEVQSSPQMIEGLKSYLRKASPETLKLYDAKGRSRFSEDSVVHITKGDADPPLDLRLRQVGESFFIVTPR